jgi:hypothetical protein
MLRTFHLPDEEYDLNILLNDRKIRSKHINVNCDRKTSVTTVLVDYIELNEPRNQTRKRKIRRFHLLNGEDAELNQITNSTHFRVVYKYDFLTDNGTVVIVDYEDKRK